MRGGCNILLILVLLLIAYIIISLFYSVNYEVAKYLPVIGITLVIATLSTGLEYYGYYDNISSESNQDTPSYYKSSILDTNIIADDLDNALEDYLKYHIKENNLDEDLNESDVIEFRDEILELVAHYVDSYELPNTSTNSSKSRYSIPINPYYYPIFFILQYTGSSLLKGDIMSPFLLLYYSPIYLEF